MIWMKFNREPEPVNIENDPKLDIIEPEQVDINEL